MCLTGCTDGGNSTKCEVSGKVTCEGKPVSEGLVSFTNTGTGDTAEAPLREGGVYAVTTPLPEGEYKVMLLPLVVRQQVEGKGPRVGVEKPAPDIPEKYRTIGTTDLKATLKKGKNEHNFDMKR